MKIKAYQNQKLKILKNMVRVVTIIFLCYSVMNYFEGIRLIYLSEFLLFLVGVFLLFKLERWPEHTIDIFSRVFSGVLCVYLLFFVLSIDGLEKTSHIWLVAIPITSYLITGIKWGKRFTIASLIVAVFILLIREHWYVTYSVLNVESVFDVLLPYVWVWALAHVYETSNANNHKTLLDIATKDSLTNLHNRRAFYDVFDKNSQYPMGLMEIDLDFFKSINDTYGHDAGDYVLKYVAEKLRKQARNQVQVFRIGGEEFAILLPKYDLDRTVNVANELLTDLRNEPIKYQDNDINVTASIGVAVSEEVCDIDTLMKKADKHLYTAKQTGRNRVVY